MGWGCTRELLASDVPVFVLLQRLSSLGWTPGLAPAIHTDDSDRHFGVRGFVRGRRYLQCLLHWNDLRQRGLTALRSDQHPNFYQRVLESAKPSEVPCDLPAIAYKDPNFGVAAALMSLEEDAAKDAEGESDSSLVVTGGTCMRIAVPSSRPPQRAVASVLAIPETTANTEDSAVQRNQETSSSSSSSSSASSSESSLPVTSAPRARDAEVVPGLSVEEHLTRDEPGHYRRFCMQCPLFFRSHPGCRKKRNRGPNQTATFGEREPEAFLFAWASAAQRFATSAEHIRFIPSAAEVRAEFRKLSDSS